MDCWVKMISECLNYNFSDSESGFNFEVFDRSDLDSDSYLAQLKLNASFGLTLQLVSKDLLQHHSLIFHWIGFKKVVQDILKTFG